MGLVLTEHLDFSRIATLLAEAGGRVFGAVINKFQSENTDSLPLINHTILVLSLY